MSLGFSLCQDIYLYLPQLPSFMIKKKKNLSYLAHHFCAWNSLYCWSTSKMADVYFHFYIGICPYMCVFALRKQLLLHACTPTCPGITFNMDLCWLINAIRVLFYISKKSQSIFLWFYIKQVLLIILWICSFLILCHSYFTTDTPHYPSLSTTIIFLVCCLFNCSPLRTIKQECSHR